MSRIGRQFVLWVWGAANVVVTVTVGIHVYLIIRFVRIESDEVGREVLAGSGAEYIKYEIAVFAVIWLAILAHSSWRWFRALREYRAQTRGESQAPS